MMKAAMVPGALEGDLVLQRLRHQLRQPLGVGLVEGLR
jgi:hypothetical protein